MGLKHCPDLAIGKQAPGGLESSADLGWMVCIIFEPLDSRQHIPTFEASFDSPVTLDSGLDPFQIHIEPRSQRNGCSRIENRVPSRNR